MYKDMHKPQSRKHKAKKHRNTHKLWLILICLFLVFGVFGVVGVVYAYPYGSENDITAPVISQVEKMLSTFFGESHTVSESGEPEKSNLYAVPYCDSKKPNVVPIGTEEDDWIFLEDRESKFVKKTNDPKVVCKVEKGSYEGIYHKKGAEIKIYYGEEPNTIVYDVKPKETPKEGPTVPEPKQEEYKEVPECKDPIHIMVKTGWEDYETVNENIKTLTNDPESVCVVKTSDGTKKVIYRKKDKQIEPKDLDEGQTRIYEVKKQKEEVPDESQEEVTPSRYNDKPSATLQPKQCDFKLDDEGLEYCLLEKDKLEFDGEKSIIYYTKKDYEAGIKDLYELREKTPHEESFIFFETPQGPMWFEIGYDETKHHVSADAQVIRKLYEKFATRGTKLFDLHTHPLKGGPPSVGDLLAYTQLNDYFNNNNLKNCIEMGVVNDEGIYTLNMNIPNFNVFATKIERITNTDFKKLVYYPFSWLESSPNYCSFVVCALSLRGHEWESFYKELGANSKFYNRDKVIPESNPKLAACCSQFIQDIDFDRWYECIPSSFKKHITWYPTCRWLITSHKKLPKICPDDAFNMGFQWGCPSIVIPKELEAERYNENYFGLFLIIYCKKYIPDEEIVMRGYTDSDFGIGKKGGSDGKPHKIQIKYSTVELCVNKPQAKLIVIDGKYNDLYSLCGDPPLRQFISGFVSLEEGMEEHYLNYEKPLKISRFGYEITGEIKDGYVTVTVQ